MKSRKLSDLILRGEILDSLAAARETIKFLSDKNKENPSIGIDIYVMTVTEFAEKSIEDAILKTTELFNFCDDIGD